MTLIIKGLFVLGARLPWEYWYRPEAFCAL